MSHCESSHERDRQPSDRLTVVLGPEVEVPSANEVLKDEAEDSPWNNVAGVRWGEQTSNKI